MTPTVIFPLKRRWVFVAGHRGMVGSAIRRRLSQEDCEVLADKLTWQQTSGRSLLSSHVLTTSISKINGAERDVVKILRWGTRVRLPAER